MNKSEDAIDGFAAAARDFCSWLEHDPYEDATEQFTALCYLSMLYSAAVRLPEINEKRLPSPSETLEIDPKLTETVMNRLDRFPGRQYWRVEQSLDAGTEKVDDDIAADLYFTYTAVKRSLLMFDRSEQDLAVWSWQFSFWLDWGQHCINAIQALHARIREHLNRED